VSSKSGDTDNILCANGVICLGEGNWCIINASGASAADSFVYGIHLRPDGPESAVIKVNETHQQKLIKSDITQQVYDAEREKAAKKKDVFILYTSADSEIKLSSMSAIVDKSCWNAYFGPFAGRTFFYKVECPSANSASYVELTGTDGIGEQFARRIIDKRPYDNLEDCYQKTKIPRRTLEVLSFNSG
jgi:hypothetical protein